MDLLGSHIVWAASQLDVPVFKLACPCELAMAKQFPGTLQTSKAQQAIQGSNKQTFSDAGRRAIGQNRRALGTSARAKMRYA